MCVNHGVLPLLIRCWMALADLYHLFIPFGLLVISGFALPMPEEMIVAGAGVFCGSHPEVYWWVMVPVLILGIAIGDSALYIIGHIWGSKLLKYNWVRTKLLPMDKQDKIKHNYHEYGLMIVLFARIIPGIRTPIFLMAGILNISFKRFMLMDAICSIPSVAIFFSLGYWFADQFMAVLNRVEGHRPLVIVVVLASVGGYLIYSFRQRKVTTGDPDSIPVIGGPLGTYAHQHVKHEDDGTLTEGMHPAVLPLINPDSTKDNANDRKLSG
jgi:membrane protein DedA with SNARE-associated domain